MISFSNVYVITSYSEQNEVLLKFFFIYLLMFCQCLCTEGLKNNFVNLKKKKKKNSNMDKLPYS